MVMMMMMMLLLKCSCFFPFTGVRCEIKRTHTQKHWTMSTNAGTEDTEEDDVEFVSVSPLHYYFHTTILISGSAP